MTSATITRGPLRPAAILVSLVLASTVLLTGPAAEAGSGAKIRTGSCSGSADWKVKAKPDDGRIEFEGEVDSNVNGQTWTWKIKHNGSVAARGTAVTRGPSGSFDVQRRVGNKSGTDRFVFRATNKGTGEVCVGRIKL